MVPHTSLFPLPMQLLRPICHFSIFTCFYIESTLSLHSRSKMASSCSSINSDIKNGDPWTLKFEALEKRRKEAQEERDTLRKLVQDLYSNVKFAKDLLPTYIQRLNELQAKVGSLELELESLKSSQDEISNPNFQNGFQCEEIVE